MLRKSFVIVCMWLGIVCGYAQQIKIQKFDIDNGFNAPIVYDIEQDEDGYLWVATANNLFKYDGGNFQSFSLDEGLNDVYCSDLLITKDQSLWISHYAGSFTQINRDSVVQVITYTQQYGNASKVLELDNGNVFGLLPNYGLVSLTDSTDHIPFTDAITGMVLDACWINNKRVCVGTSDGIFLYTENGFRKIITHRFSTLMTLTLYGDKYLLLGTDTGVFSYDTEKKTFKLIVATEGEQINAITVSEENQLLVSTTTGVHIYAIDNNFEVLSTELYNKKSGLSTDYINKAIKSKEGEVWLATFGDYLLKVKDAIVNLSNIRTSCRDFLYTKEGLLISTDKGLAVYNQAEDTLDYKIESEFVGALSRYIEGGFLVSIEGETYAFDLKTEALSPIVSLAGYKVKGILYDEIHKGYWFTLFNNGVIFWDNKTKLIKHYNTQNGLAHNNVENVLVDTKGKVWLPTKNSKLSILDFETSTFSYLGIDDGLLTTEVTDVCEDRDGNIWMTSLGQGIFLYDGHKIKQYSSSTGLPTNYFYSVSSSENVMAFMTKHSLMVLNLDTKEQVVHSIPNDAGNIVATKVFSVDGKKYCNTEEGFLVYESTKEQWRISTVVDLLSLKVNDVPYSIFNKNELSPGEYDVKIKYNGVSLSYHPNLSYRYKLIGLHTEWQQTLDENILFPSLEDGEYEFVIQASIDRILWSKPKKIYLTIAKPIWKKWWFYVLLALFLTALVFIILDIRLKKLREAKKILKTKVEDRTKELQEKNVKVAQQNRELGEVNKALTDSINYAEKIQQAVMSPKHKQEFSLRNSLFILNKPRDIVSGDFYWLTEKDGKDYVVVADCTGHGVPGAFMSMLGIAFLNHIINEKKITNAGEILNELRTKIVGALENEEEERQSNDGMDISVLVFDLEKEKVQFSGANNPLILIRNGEVQRIRGDKMPVGISSLMEDKFVSHELDVLDEDVFYIFSDGYADQFGGPRNKKFMTRKFRELLLEISTLPLSNQKDVLNNRLEEWRGEEPQVDDILVMGIKP